MRPTRPALLLCLSVVPALGETTHDHAGHDHSGHDHAAHGPSVLAAPEEPAWFHFHPHATLAMAIGGSTSDKNAALIAGGHAPVDDGFNLQGFEFGALAEFGSVLALQANYNLFWDRHFGWDGEFEDAFARIGLPAGLALRGGQFAAPFGYQNQLHLHERAFVEPPVSVIRLLGEEGLYLQGAELAWALVDERTTLRAGFGRARSHRHGGGHDHSHEDEEHDHHDDDHHEDEHEEGDHEDTHEEHREEESGHFEADLAYLDDEIFFARLATEALPGLADAGLSFTLGENGFGRTTWILGADLHGRSRIAERPAWWRAEAWLRRVDAYDLAGLPGHFEDGGVMLEGGVEFLEDWTTAGRVEWASGAADLDQEERWRFSANVGRRLELGPAELHTRLQYSLDQLADSGPEHSLWLQFVVNFGDGTHLH